MNIDVEKARGLIEDEKPSLVVFGQSSPVPHPVKEWQKPVQNGRISSGL